MLIKNALINHELVDIRLGTVIEDIRTGIVPFKDEVVLNARHFKVTPGLHDHHIHFFASLARDYSVDCGPPAISDFMQLKESLNAKDEAVQWIRGFGYHESVAGELDRFCLDKINDERPIRLQHRTGKMWVLNTKACELLGVQEHLHMDGVETDGKGNPTGRLFRLDGWLRERLEEENRELVAPFSQKLLQFGITGFTDASYTNNVETSRYFQQLKSAGHIKQRYRLMGDETLEDGFLKIMLDEDALPVFDELIVRIDKAHSVDRGVAFHCVTDLELLFALEALGGADNVRNDRIEHASLVTGQQIEKMRELEVTVVTQPGFILAKGDQYLKDVSQEDLPNLYRYKSLLDSEISVLSSSDGPYGPISPFEVVDAAVNRMTRSGKVIGAEEVVSSDEALSGYLKNPDQLGSPPFAVSLGDPADLCILESSSTDPFKFSKDDVVFHTIIGGEICYSASSSRIS